MAEKKKDHWGFLAEILGTKSSRKKANEEAIEEVTDAVIEEVEATSAETAPETVDAVEEEAVIEVADTGVVLALGRVVAVSDAATLAADQALRHAYLGF